MLDNRDARHAGADALVVFAMRLGPYAEEMILAAYGPDWRRTRGFGASAGDQGKSTRDASGLLAALQPGNELEAFAARGSARWGRLSELAGEARILRNWLTHEPATWGSEQGLRLVNRVGEILDELGLSDAGASEELARLRSQATLSLVADPATRVSELRHEYLGSLQDSTGFVALAGIGGGPSAPTGRARLEAVYAVPSFKSLDGAPLELAELLRHRRLVVKAAPGMGKTTLLSRLARLAAFGWEGQPERRLPVVIPAPGLAAALRRDPGLSLRRYLSLRHSDRFGPLFAAAMGEGGVLVLVDALDEVADPGDYGLVVAAVGAFAAEFGRSGVVVTTRPHGFVLPREWTGFEVVDLQPLNYTGQCRLVGAWLDVLEPRDAGAPEAFVTREQRFLAGLEASGLPEDLASTPMLLTMLVLLRHRMGELPSGRAALFGLAADALIDDLPQRRSKGFGGARRMIEALEAIGRCLVGSGAAEIGEDDARRCWADPPSGEEHEEDEAVGLLEEISSLTGVLLEVGRSGGKHRYGFVHRSFAEYFAARSLLRDWSAGRLKPAEYADSRRWAGAFSMYGEMVAAGGPEGSSRLVRSLLAAEAGPGARVGRMTWAAVDLVGEGVCPAPAAMAELTTAAVAQAVRAGGEGLLPGRAYRLLRAFWAVTTTREGGGSGGVAAAMLDALDAADDNPASASRRRWLLVRLGVADTETVAQLLGDQAGLAGELGPGSVADAVGAVIGGAVIPRGFAPWHCYDDYPVPELEFEPEAGPQFNPDNPPEILVCGDFRRVRGPKPWDPASEVNPPVDPGAASGRYNLDDVPLHSARSVIDGVAPAKEPDAVWRFDVGSLRHLGVGDLLALARVPGAGWWLARAIRYWPDWHSLAIPDIRALEEAPEALDAAGARLLGELAHCPADGTYPWARLLAATAVGGSEAGRVEALGCLADWAERLADDEDHVPPWDDDAGAELAEALPSAIDGQPAAAAMLVRGIQASRGASRASISALAVRIAADHDSPIARGFSRTAAGLAGLTDRPARMLASPDLVAAAAGAPEAWRRDGARLLGALLVSASNEEERRALAAVLDSVIAVAPYGGTGPIPAQSLRNADAEDVARQRAKSSRWEDRAWAASILAALDRGTAADVLAPLLADGIFDVSEAAIEALKAPDLRDTEWLLEAVPAFLAVRGDHLGARLGARLGSLLDPAGLQFAIEVVDLYLGDEPDDPAASALLDALLDALPGPAA